jgi:hypothetical protein
MDFPESTREKAQKALTSIHGAYTLSNTKESGSEIDDLMIKDFLDTLAEVALAAASRKMSR